jgi:hypothetical protein
VQIRDAIAFHIDGLREDGLPIAEATSEVEYIDRAEGRRPPWRPTSAQPVRRSDREQTSCPAARAAARMPHPL